MAPEIDVKTSDLQGRYEFQVTVQDKRSSTQHRVSLSKSDYQRLVGNRDTSPEKLVTASFRFLLEREPKESILRSFDLTVISRYFPEYEREIQRRL
jgi:hypothetical protein